MSETLSGKSMIEKMAVAAINKMRAIKGRTEWVARLEPHMMEEWYQCMRAALSAAREPTEAMLKASAGEGVDHYIDGSGGVTREQWQAMIDAALKEGPL